MVKSIGRMLGAAMVVAALPGLAAAQTAGGAVASGWAANRTTSGPVQGVSTSDRKVTAFKGLPYAAAPVGDRRWRAPQPPPSWTAMRRADQFGSSCMQTIVEERKPWTYEFMAHNATSEDCLFLNVWTSARISEGPLPVLVWIHGGGNVEGSAAIPIYDGEQLARRGVVVVSINYRLGVFGFLAHPELTKEAGRSGNYGLLDQLAALRWVQQNIAAFGGDPNRVAIAGQSAGASGVHNLVASPLAKGLFHRAIAQSGSAYASPNPMPRLADAEKVGVAFAEAKGAASVKDLRAMPAEQLMARVGDAPGPAFRPAIDVYVLPADPIAIYARGEQNDVPELTGMNLDEQSSSRDYGALPMAQHEKTVMDRFGETSAAGYFRLYPNDTQDRSGESQKAAARDAGLVSMHLWAEHRAKTARSPAFTYYWTHPMPGPDSGRYGAFHTSEVPYVFNTLGQSDRPWRDEDRRLAGMMGSYWVNFITTGDPNGNGLPRWPAFASGSAVTMELGPTSGPRPVVPSDRLQFWRAYLTRPAAVTR
jgi:para-nitrobenzyl esterase